jgi:hypothetical protein
MLHSHMKEPDHGACDTRPIHTTRCDSIVHAAFGRTLTDDLLAEEIQCNGLVNSLHSGPLTVLLVQDIE